MYSNIHNRKALSLTLVFVGLLLVVVGCSINLTIETDYAAQANDKGDIKEESNAESTAETKAKVDATVEVPVSEPIP